MKQYIDKSALVAEIEKIIEEPAPSHDQQCPWEDGYWCGLYKAESVINALEVKEGEEEPVSNDLEEAANDYAHDLVHDDVFENFIAGAQWQKEQMMKDTVEREVKVDAGGYPYIDATELYDYDIDEPLAKAGDKVKLIIIKEDGNT